MGRGYPQDGQGLWEVLFESGCGSRSRLLVAGHDVAEPSLSLGRLIGVEDAAEFAGNLRSHGDLRHVGHGVLHDMELAALPGHSGEDGLPGGLEPGVAVADDELDTPHPTVDEALEEGTPVRLCLGELHGAAEDASLAVGADPDGREQCARHDRPVVADFFVAGIEDEVGDLADRPVPPGTELLVELGRRAALLGGGDVQAAELLDDGRDLPGAGALDVHLGDSKGHGPFAADAPPEGPGVERPPFSSQ